MALADAELVIGNWLQAELGGGYRVVTELPASLATVVAATPVVQVVRFGGEDDAYTLDTANVDVDAFGTTRQAAHDLSEQVRTALRLHAPGQVQDGALIATVSTISAPRWVPYDNTDLRRFVASYRITLRSVPVEGVLA